MSEQITTLEALDALPDLTAVLDIDSDVWQKRDGSWFCTDPSTVDDSPADRHPRHYLPATVLFRPDVPRD